MVLFQIIIMYKKITGLFASTPYNKTGTPFTIACIGKTPRTIASSDSFKISTYDFNMNVIESRTTGITIKMNSTPEIYNFTISPESYIINANTTYLFIIES